MLCIDILFVWDVLEGIFLVLWVDLGAILEESNCYLVNLAVWTVLSPLVWIQTNSYACCGSNIENRSH